MREIKLPASPTKLPAAVRRLRAVLNRTSEPEQLVRLIIAFDQIEQLMARLGLYKTDEVRPANEARFDARAKLGRELAKIVRGKRGRKGANLSRVGTNFRAVIRELGLDKNRASEAERIGAMPDKERVKEYEQARRANVLNSVRDMLLASRPFWHQEKRKQRHRKIVEAAAAAKAPDKLGPFALFYADPPWVFETHTPDRTHRMPDDHYPTLTDAEIINFKVLDRWTVPELATPDAMLFLWCTSSNLARALDVMKGWGFEYKTHAIWDKEKIGLGLIFRNQHEVLLYGSRIGGAPPKPIELPPSVFRFPRTEHSAKPPEIRQTLARMYPFFGADHRIEMFSRDQIAEWTCVGYEASRQAAE